MPTLRRLTKVFAVVMMVVALAGCLPLAALPGAVVGAVGLYCAAVSDQGKAMARDALSKGVPLIACPESDVGADAPPSS